MRYINKLKMPKRTKKSYKFNNLDKLSGNPYNSKAGGYMAYNFDVYNNKLCSGIGFKQAVFTFDVTDHHVTITLKPHINIASANMLRIVSFYYYEKTADRNYTEFILLGTDARFYGYRWDDLTGSIGSVDNRVFTTTARVMPYYLKDENVLIVNNERGIYLLRDIGQTLKQATLNATDLCVYNDKLYVLDGDYTNCIRYSNNLDPFSWSENLEDSIALRLTDERGELRRLINFKGNLYIIRAQGITRLTEQDDILSTTHLFSTKSVIYRDSVCSCGDELYMLLSDGIYIFNGSSTKKFDSYINNIIQSADNDNVCACFSNGKYYLACKADFKDGQKVGCEQGTYNNNALIEIDVMTKQVQILRGIDIQGMTNLFYHNDSRTFCIINERSGKTGVYQLTHEGKYIEEDVEHTKSYKTTFVDFGTDTVKTIERISLHTSADITIRVVSTTGQVKTLNVTGKQGIQMIDVGLRGRAFSIEISTTADNITVSDITAHYSYSSHTEYYEQV